MMVAHRIALIGLGAIILTATAALAQNTSNPLVSGNTANPVLSGQSALSLDGANFAFLLHFPTL